MNALFELRENGPSMFDLLQDGVVIFSAAVPVNQPKEYKDNKSSIKNLVKLKEAGFTADEIIEFKREGAI